MVSLATLFKIFLKIGSLGFGGPIALISMMESELCEKRKWIPRERFQDKYVICKLLPGPVAYQMALSLGRELRGFWGGLACALGFLLPGVALILTLAVFYSQLKDWKQFSEISEGLSLGAFFIIFESTVRLAKPEWGGGWKNRIYILISFILMFLFPRFEPLIIIGIGILFLSMHLKTNGTLASVLFPLFWVHFKSAWIVFGTGLAVIPVLQQDIVSVHHWLDAKTFLDGITFGQITPGPVTITSVFIGYQVASYLGALVSFLGMYLPGAILILGVVPHLEAKMLKSKNAKLFKQGAVCGVVGCIFAAVFIMYGISFFNFRNVLVLAVFGLLCWGFKWPSIWMIPLGGAAVYFLKYVF